MPTISGGRIIEAGATANPGLMSRVYRSNGVPTDANLGIVTPVNGMVAEDMATGNIYERQAAVWVRIDTIAGAIQ